MALVATSACIRQRSFVMVILRRSRGRTAFAGAIALPLCPQRRGPKVCRIFAADKEERILEQILTSYAGGTGDSPTTAITILAPGLTTAIHGEYWYLFYVYGRNWRLGREQRSTSNGNGRVFDQLEFILPDQTPKWT
jgi:hypothetical protein